MSFVVQNNNKEYVNLTNRELEVLELVSYGYSNKKIADKLYVSTYTIKAHVSSLFSKISAKNRVDATRIYNKVKVKLKSYL